METLTSNPVDRMATAPRSSLVNGFNHVARSTQDLDRLVAFYRDTMDLPFVELTDPRGRHGFLLLGGSASPATTAMLHLFEVPAAIADYGDRDAMFMHGALDHMAIEAADERSLATMRERLIAAGASDGTLQVFGGWLLSLHVVDPDGVRLEVACHRTGDVFSDDEVVFAD